jgi:hypothetical protein
MPKLSLKIDKDTQQLNKYLESFSKKSKPEIFKEMTELLIKNISSKEDILKLRAYRNLLEKQDDFKYSSDYTPYPDIFDPDFNLKLITKKEVYIHKSKPIDNSISIEEYTKQLCKFKLSNNQKFLKLFLSPNTPYNGILLFHGTGVGKTCSSISIAETFKPMLLASDKKVIVLLNPSIKDNFIKNIFNIERVKQGIPREQCTKDSYIKEARTKNISQMNKKIMKIVNARYSFYGYIEFGNIIQKIVESPKLKELDDKIKEEVIHKKIESMFSNTIMIIDEVHNIKDSGKKKLPTLLKKVLEYAINLKLVLLSATPMFDKASDIIDIINYLLVNDNRLPLNKKIFDSNGFLSREGWNILKQKTRGYISYLRGENPIKFPKRLYPDVNNDKNLISQFPSINLKGNAIPEEEQISTLKIIGCPMKDFQLTMYNKLDMSETEDDYGSFNINAIMASNMIYPGEESSPVNNLISKRGFNTLLKERGKKGIEFLNEDTKNIFSKETIGNYSSKLGHILNSLDKSSGIVFIYSQFIYSGILPLALALEMNGYSKFGGSLIIDKPTKDTDKKYILITGDNDLSQNAYREYLKIENENKDGSKVKVIIGSETAAEGLDFKYIREVHVLDPWYHFNKIEQIIGRGIRNCSHKDLPFKDRNVTVYLYAGVKQLNDKQESIDLKMYRMSELKLRQIADVEYYLKINAIDCNLNIEENRFINDIFKKKYKIVTSRGTTTFVSLNDEDNSKMCQFRSCDFKCDPDVTEIENDKLNTSTFSYSAIKDTIDDIKQLIKGLYQKDIIYEKSTIETILKKIYTPDLIDNALEDLVNNKEELLDMYERPGIIAQKGHVYLFKPLYLEDQDVTFDDIKRPHTKKRTQLNITTFNKFKSKLNKKTQKPTSISSIMSKLLKIKNDFIEKIKIDTKYYSQEKQKYLLNKYNEIGDFSFDLLPINDKESLLKYIIEKSRTTTSLTPFDKDIMKKCGSYLLKYNRDIDTLSESDDYLWGYKLALSHTKVSYIKYLKKEDVFKQATPDETKQILKTIKQRIKDSSELSKIIGYLEIKPVINEIQLKIRDKINEGKKGIHIKTGSVCGNQGMKKGTITELIHKTLKEPNELITDPAFVGIYTKTTKTNIPGKVNLCAELELYLRYNNYLMKDNLLWFFTCEEAIERELNKK